VNAAPEEGWEYHQLQRYGRCSWGWMLLGVICVLVGALFIAPGIVTIPFVLAYAALGHSSATAALSTNPVHPLGLAYVNVTLAVAIPVVLLVSWAVNRLAPGWVVSVVRGFRVRWFLESAACALVALAATLVVSLVVPSYPGDTTISSHHNAFTSTTLAFALVVLLLTPLQAAGEEFLFRGYLTQAFGSLFGRRWVAVVLPAVLFTLAHSQSSTISGSAFLGQPYSALVDRLAFGLVSGVLVIATGGLEAGIAMHALNNYLAFGLALAFGNMTAALNPSGSSWWDLPVTMTQSLVFLGLVVWLARRRGVRTRSRQRGDFVSPAPAL